MKSELQTCDCGVTVEQKGCWFACPAKGYKPVCESCCRKCEHMKIYNGYMPKCLYHEHKKRPSERDGEREKI